MKTFQSRLSSQRGAVLIQVGIALLGLIAFATFVADYGIMWASRGQAQTSADAGALSGAIALAFDSETDFAGAKAKAQAVAKANSVFGQPPDVQLGNADITFPPCPPGAPGLPDTCVKVNVYRNAPRGNALPIFFGSLVGVVNQGVRATATAQIVTGDTTDCLKPWAVVDRWDEYNFPAHPEHNYPNPDPDFNPAGQPPSTFDKWSDGKGQNPPQEDDYYVPPSATSAGTGFRLPGDEGRRFAVKADGANTISSGWFMELLLPRADGHWTGGNVYGENITTCGGLPYSIAAPGTVCPASIGQSDAAYWAAKGCFGVKPGGTVGPTRAGIDTLTAQDPSASYNTSTNTIVNSTFSPPTRSPRVVPIATMDIDDYLSRNPTGSTGTVRLANIYGYFIEGMGDVDKNTGVMTLNANGKAVIGRIITIPGLGTGSSPLPASASFLRTIILVR
jgi:Flp pilus assembly protein TadG